MVIHIVLFRPKPGLTVPEQIALEQSVTKVCREVPSIKRFRVGRRVLHGRDYEKAMPENFPYAAVIEFDDLEGLQSYLQHPLHDDLASRFTEALDTKLIYDFKMEENKNFNID
jgi:hypothetical protein